MADCEIRMCLTPDALDGALPAVIAMLTNTKASLLLAHLHEAVGDCATAIKFAENGLVVAAPMAVGPKAMLKNLLHRLLEVIE